MFGNCLSNARSSVNNIPMRFIILVSLFFSCHNDVFIHKNLFVQSVETLRVSTNIPLTPRRGSPWRQLLLKQRQAGIDDTCLQITGPRVPGRDMASIPGGHWKSCT